MRVRHMYAGLFGVVAILWLLYWLFTRAWPVSPLTIKEQQMTDSLFAKTKPQCLGRYLFDLPVSFNNTVAGQVKFNGMSLTSKRLYRPAFEQSVAVRENELKKKHTVRKIHAPFLKQVYRINTDTVIFDRNENESVAGFARILEGHLYIDGVAFTVTYKFRDVSDPKYRQEKEAYLKRGRTEKDLNEKPQRLAEMQSLLARLRGRADDEVPVQPGICIPNGFINDSSRKTRENISMIYHPGDFELVVNSNSAIKEKQSLLERGSEINAVILRLGARTLRKGTVNLPGINAEEWLIKAGQDIHWPAEKHTDYYTFKLYGNEKATDSLYPAFSVSLHNSGREVKSYTDSQMVAIWDRITRTFRYRPGAF